MCFGGGSKQYNAYEAGDFGRWKNAFDKSSEIETALARGEIDEATAAERRAGLGDIDALANKAKQDAAAAMEMREATRQRDVKLGQIGIDKNFAKFDDGYYDTFKQDYVSHYNPQIDRQHSDAVDKMTAALANRGILESSVGAGGFAELGRKNAEARIDVANEGLDAANKLRGQVQQAKSNLYNLNEASANPQAVNAQAVGQATAIVAPPQFSPLGEIFATTLANFAPYIRNPASQPRRYASPYGTSSAGGSSTIVR